MSIAAALTYYNHCVYWYCRAVSDDLETNELNENSTHQA